MSNLHSSKWKSNHSSKQIEDQQAEIAAAVAVGEVSKKDLAKDFAAKFGLSRRVVYEFLIKKF